MRDFEERPYWHKRYWIVGSIVGGIVGAVVLAFLFGYFIMLLWNWLMPLLFGLKIIDYWQAFGIALLARLLFCSFGGHGHSHHGHKYRKWNKDCGGGWEDSSEWKVKGDWHNWKHYKDYWREEGKASFEKYLEKRESEKKDDTDTKQES
jgi:hypothetical protein